jgi:hypothetical protein
MGLSPPLKQFRDLPATGHTQRDTLVFWQHLPIVAQTGRLVKGEVLCTVTQLTTVVVALEASNVHVPYGDIGSSRHKRVLSGFYLPQRTVSRSENSSAIQVGSYWISGLWT